MRSYVFVTCSALHACMQAADQVINAPRDEMPAQYPPTIDPRNQSYDGVSSYVIPAAFSDMCAFPPLLSHDIVISILRFTPSTHRNTSHRAICPLEQCSERVEDLCWDMEMHCSELAARHLLQHLVILPPNVRVCSEPPPAYTDPTTLDRFGPLYFHHNFMQPQPNQ